MSVTEFGTLEECLGVSTNASEEYDAAKKANDLLIETMDIAEPQKILLKRSTARLLESYRESLKKQNEETDKTITIDGCTYRYEVNVDDGFKRIIKGREIIDWIQQYHVEDISIFVTDEGLYFTLVDTENDNHTREYRLNWPSHYGKFEISDNVLDPED